LRISGNIILILTTLVLFFYPSFNAKNSLVAAGFIYFTLNSTFIFTFGIGTLGTVLIAVSKALCLAPVLIKE
jgi:hypothetical protein